jgi:predicted RNA-binding Zn-ribbon protein involved in translation (DUF1610 family)
MNKYLFKANDNVISHCHCDDAPAMSTGQLDCPWCGCGWLISCSKCRKAYTYGVIALTDRSLIDLGREEVKSRGLTNVSEQEIAEWAEGMSEAFEPFSIGETIVYLDGSYFSLDATDIEFDGYFAHHEFKVLPHKVAMSDTAQLDAILGDPTYWRKRELPDSE